MTSRQKITKAAMQRAGMPNLPSMRRGRPAPPKRGRPTFAGPQNGRPTSAGMGRKGGSRITAETMDATRAPSGKIVGRFASVDGGPMRPNPQLADARRGGTPQVRKYLQQQATGPTPYRRRRPGRMVGNKPFRQGAMA